MVHGLVKISLKFGWRSKNLIILICGRLKRNRNVLETNGSKKIVYRFEYWTSGGITFKK